MSNRPSAPRKVIRLSEARLQAVSSRNMYSEQGFEALIRPLAGQVCHSLIVLSNWTPGSAQDQAASPIFSHRSAALMVLDLAVGAAEQLPFATGQQRLDEAVGHAH